jgi:methyl-CpG-binding domain protein 4
MLLQEKYRDDPWKVLVVCILMNKTGGDQACPVAARIFERYPDAGSLASEDPEKLHDLLRPLGLWKKRSSTLVRFSKEYALWDFEDPSELHGIGEYGADSYRIFVEGNLNTFPNDKELKRYLIQRLEEA